MSAFTNHLSYHVVVGEWLDWTPKPQNPRVLLLLDDMGENVKEDVFFCRQYRKGYSFLDFSKEINDGLIRVPNVVLCCIGIGYIFKWGLMELQKQLQQFMQAVCGMGWGTEVWISTLLPLPSRMHKTGDPMLRFNGNLIRAVQGIKSMGCRINCIKSHELFMTETSQLDE